MLSVLLTKSGYEIDAAADGQEALDKIEKTQYDFILCDIKMPKMNGMEFLTASRGKLLATTVIMMSAYGGIDTAIEAMKLGAYDYISKPFKPDEVYLTLRKAEERESLRRENLWLKKRIQSYEKNYQFCNMVAKSNSMKSIFKLAEKISNYNSTVLITGESGTGKELVARGIHLSGNRSERPLVTVNCGGIPENLLESEFFGYKKGAFTGADRTKKGLFEEADGGTIFLDEIGELPQALQVKLLRVLQESEIRMIGDTKTKKIDVRVIAATAKELEEEVSTGGFRQDLFYRLNVLPITIPPLRTRNEDIPLLVQHFMNKFNKSLNKQVKGLEPDAMSMLLRHKWPGNVRELENVIERALVLVDGDILTLEHFPPELGAKIEECRMGDMLEGFSIKENQKIMEKNPDHQSAC